MGFDFINQTQAGPSVCIFSLCLLNVQQLIFHASVAIQLCMLFKWQSTVLSTILPLFMCITKNNTCTMYINCCTCSQTKYAWNISCWTLSKQSEKIHTDGPACVRTVLLWFSYSLKLLKWNHIACYGFRYTFLNNQKSSM
jgi:hypothetical protein